MDREYLKLLADTKYYVLYSERTKKPFIDKNGNTYAFQIKREADEFIKLLPVPCYIKEPITLEQNKQIVDFYAMGSGNLRIRKGGEDFKDIPIRANDVPRTIYYNPELNFDIELLKETSEKQYMDALNRDFFFIPVALPDRSLGSFPVIYYVDAFLKSGQHYVVLFSTVDEFNKWNEIYNKNCVSLKVKMEKIKKIVKDRDVIINPMSDKLFLLNTQLKDINNEKGDKKRNGK